MTSPEFWAALGSILLLIATRVVDRSLPEPEDKYHHEQEDHTRV